MNTSIFSFELPENLIAQYPSAERGQSRLMTLNRQTGIRSHEKCSRLPEIIADGPFLEPSGKKPLIVFNNTKVRKARLLGVSQSGTQVEFLLLEKVNKYKWKILVQHSRRRKHGQCFTFYNNEHAEITRAVITESSSESHYLEFESDIDDEWLEKYGHVPLPPYIKRKDAPEDALRYQTIYASHTGSAAAPTAGLHFTTEIMNSLTANGIESVFLTLHVGLGTFLPVRCENITNHVMHEEQFIITEDTAQKIVKAKREKRKIIAVGTTTLRALESAVYYNGIKSGKQSTSIFIYPGYEFKTADALFTNFHTPFSTLLMLVCAFAGRELIFESYAEAVKENYRFFSYGDAMLIY